MTRRTFAMLPLTAGLQGAPAPVALENRNHRIELDRATGQLLSLRASAAPQEFIESGDPRAFVIQYLDKDKEFRQIPSTAARTISVTESSGTVKAEFRALAGLDLDAEVIMKSAGDVTRWSIAINNRSGIL